MTLFKGSLLLITALGLSAISVNSVIAQEKVLSVDSVERILVQYKRLPVYISLAHLEFPSDPSLNKQAKDRLSELLNGKGVDVLFEEGYGSNDSGAPFVYLRQGKVFVNVILVSEGLARYKASDNPSSYERLLANAARMAERNKVGMFADGSAGSGQAVTQPEQAAPARPKPTGKKARSGERFASELNGRYYYPEKHPAMAKVHPNRIIYYNDEESARAAGKQRAPQVNESSMPADDGSIQSAEKVFELGESMMGKAQAMPATPERDRAYTEVLQVLTEAVQRFSALMEKKPNDEGLGEKLRRAMQLRYGAMKMRRM